MKWSLSGNFKAIQYSNENQNHSQDHSLPSSPSCFFRSVSRDKWDSVMNPTLNHPPLGHYKVNSEFEKIWVKRKRTGTSSRW